MLNFQRPAVLYLIKHSLGSFLKGDIDASQVDSRIGAGFLELRDLQLNCDYISAFLRFTGLEVVDGFVSRIEVQVDWTEFSARIALEEVLVTVRPCKPPARDQSSLTPPCQEQDRDEQGGMFTQQTLLDYFLKKLKIVLVGITIRLEDSSVAQKVLMVHGDRVACGFDQDGLPELEEFEPEQNPSFSVVVEGISLEVWDSDQDDESSRNVELAALEGGKIQFTDDKSSGCIERHVEITLGSGGVSIEASLVEYLKEGICIACELAKKCANSMKEGKLENSQGEHTSGSSCWPVSDDDDFHESGSGTPVSSRSDCTSSNQTNFAGASKSQPSCLHIHCTSPLFYFSLDYLPDNPGDTREACGGLDLFLERICFSGTLCSDSGAMMELSVASIICFERMPTGEAQLSPKQAQELVAQLKCAPRKLQDFVLHGAQVAVNSHGSADVLPLLQFGLYGSNSNDKNRKPCLVLQLKQSQPDSIEITIHSEPVAIWCSFKSLKNILTLVDVLREGLEKDTSSACPISINDQVQRVINDIDSQAVPETKCAGILVARWWTPAILFVIEKPVSDDGRNGFLFGQWCCHTSPSSSKEEENPFLRFEKSQERKNIRRRVGGGKIEKFHIQAVNLEVFNVSRPTEDHEGIMSCILQFKKRFGKTSRSNLMHQLDELASPHAIDIEIRVRPDYIGHLMVDFADSFLEWHSSDRWTKEDGCWHQEESYREMEFQAKCVDNAKVFVRVQLGAVKANLTQLDIKDTSDLLASIIPSREKDSTLSENKDQMTFLVTGSIDCNLRSPQSWIATLDNSPLKPTVDYQISIEDMGFLQTEGFSGKPNSAQWVWLRGAKLSGGPLPTCWVFLPAPLDSQLPNPPGIEFAKVSKSSKYMSGGTQNTQRTSLRLKGVTVSTDMDDLDFSTLRGLAQYSPSNKSKGTSEKEATLFALNLENMGIRCEPRRSWVSTEACPSVSGVVYIEGAHCSGSSWMTSHQIVVRSLSAHLANCANREHDKWEIDRPIDLQQIQLHNEGFCCLAREGTLRVELHLSDQESKDTERRARRQVDIGNQQFLGTFSHESLGLATCFVRQLQSIVPADMVSESGEKMGNSSGCERINLLEALDENAFRPNPFESLLDSECANGTWREEFIMNGGIVDDWISDFPCAATCPSDSIYTPSPVDSSQGVWLNGAPPTVLEDYIPEPPACDDSRALRNGKNGCLRLLDDHPEPLLTVNLQDASVICILKDKSMRQEEKIELEIQGLSVRIDSFPDDSQYVWRSAIQVQCFELRDCRNAANQAWSTILSRFIQQPQILEYQCTHTLSSPMLEFTLEAVQPSEGKLQEEMRAQISLVPLRLRLDQAVIKFFAEYIDSIPSAPEPLNQIPLEDVPFFQFCEVEAIHLVVDYLPRKLDIGALRSGSLGEVMNFVRWGGVKLNLKNMKLSGLVGWDSLLAAVIKEWQSDVIGKQAHKFVKGIPPVRSILRIGSACQSVLSDSVETIMPPILSRNSSNKSHVRGRLRQSSVELLRVIVLEALNAGAAAAAGAQMVLLGSVDGTLHGKSGKTVAPGFYQTRACVESAFNTIVKEPVESYKNGEGAGPLLLKTLRATPAALVAPATAAATALRCTLVGCKNKLDADRTLDD